MLTEQTKLNEHAIKIEKSKQLLYRPIYSLGTVELEALKIYIEIYLKIGFIWPSKSLANIPILFDKKLDGNFRLYGNYYNLNNLIIKNWDPILLIGKSLNYLGQTKQFTQLDLTNAYHWMRVKKSNK